MGQYLQGNENACYDLINYVCQVKKPKDINVISFQIYLESMNLAAAWFPGNSEILSDEDFKTAFHTAMPKPWHDTFVRAHCVVADMTVSAISGYMQKLEGLNAVLRDSGKKAQVA